MLTDKRRTAPHVYADHDRLPTPADRVLGDPRVILVAALALLAAPVVLVYALWSLAPGALKSFLSSQFLFSLLMLALTLFIIIHLCAGLILLERKLSAWIQDRKGPNRVGYWGLLQPILDGVKFILKEDIIPANADKPLFFLAPCVAFVVALTTFAIIPWAGEIRWPWTDAAGNPVIVTTQAVSIDLGLLYLLAIGSMSVYGVVLAGWASNNKYAFYGGMRAAAQMISYEIPLGLGVLVIFLLAGSVRPEVIVNQQAASGLWNVFHHPLIFVLVFVTALAETNRAPFDLAECEQELVAGYHTEYSGMKFALFYLAEYAHMIVASAVLTVLFLGGWAPLPFSSWYSSAGGAIEPTWWNTSWIAALIKFHVFWGKIMVLLALFMVVRWTIPRFRFDQLMRLAWKGMIPIGMVVLAGEAILAAFGWQRALLANLALNAAVLGVLLFVMGRSQQPVTGRQEDLPDVRVYPTA